VNVLLISQPLVAGVAVSVKGRVSDIVVECNAEQYETILGIIRGFQQQLSVSSDEIPLWKCSRCAMMNSITLDECTLCAASKPRPVQRRIRDAFYVPSARIVTKIVEFQLASLTARIVNTDIPITEVIIRDARIAMKQFEDHSLHLRAAIYSVIVRDIRPESRARVRDIICAVKQSKTKLLADPPPQFELQLNRTANDDMDLTAVVDNIRAHIVSDALAPAIAFIAPPIVRLILPSDPKPESQHRTIADTALRAKLNLTNVEVVILRNGVSHEEPAPALRAAFFLQFEEDCDGRAIIFKGFDIHAFVCPPMSRVCICHYFLFIN